MDSSKQKSDISARTPQYHLEALILDYSEILIGLTYVMVGAFIGFFGSIIHDLWKEKREQKELEDRIKEDLEIIKDELVSDLKTGSVRARAFFTDVYLALKQDLIHKLNVKTSQNIMQTYIKLDELRYPTTRAEDMKEKYLEVIKVVEETLRSL